MDFQESKETSNANDSFRYLSLIVTVFISLLCFFIILNVISNSNSQKSEQVSKSINNEFKNKDIKKELNLFEQKTVIGSENKPNEQTFRDIITSIMGAMKDSMDHEYSETVSNHIVKININSFFGPGSNETRARVVNFLNYLNKNLETIRKNPNNTAKLIIPFDETSNDDYNSAKERIKFLSKNVGVKGGRGISFSAIPVDPYKNPEKLNNIFLYFAKNEF